ncbi:hypothetical protein K493DRAFT_320860 [Basidiobolus meristosporus CBS 931.73]|uniref:Uncharacterized protein n=1 Tax=Basidiobolus meristosporus CBS 931.73 TaxID=1314790 RepID=A0A1Y1X5H2_9FUNG|nr:hypothetical protein K493DRAFT_320860 [Basidiobolus meristosporus CBS 931.73]|eukprot:ORX80564.1 hypothetical protein K493DRAFT_320860 [Basidiobolus meristosporus CBS 931.73]
MFATQAIRSTVTRFASEAPKFVVIGAGIAGLSWYGSKIVSGQEVFYLNFKKQTA